jgi:hypothetical protein
MVKCVSHVRTQENETGGNTRNQTKVKNGYAKYVNLLIKYKWDFFIFEKLGI